MEALFGVLVSVFSLGLTLVGLPAQIVKNHREKRSGQPLLTIAIALSFYISQIGFFSLIGAYLPLASFVIGFVMWSVLLLQYFLYRDHSGSHQS